MQSPIKILYLGEDESALPVLINSPDFKIEAAGRISSFFKKKSKNPVDRFFKKAYLALCEEDFENARRYNHRFQEWKAIASTFFRQNSQYLDLLTTHNIKVIKASKENLPQKTRELDIKLFLVNGWTMLPAATLALPELGCINIHPSALPKYRGALPLVWALKHGDKESAVTYMTLDHTMDGGQVLRQVPFPISEKDDPVSLVSAVQEVIKQTVVETLKEYVEGQITPIEQDHSLASKTARYEDYKLIDFKEEKARDIYHKILHYRFFDGKNCSYFYHRDQKIRVLNCRSLSKDKELAPGEAVIKYPYLHIGCNDFTMKFCLLRDFRLKDLPKLKGMESTMIAHYN